MKFNQKVGSIYFFLGAFGFYAAAVMGFKNGLSSAPMYLIIGSVALIIGAFNMANAKKNKDEDKKK